MYIKEISLKDIRGAVGSRRYLFQYQTETNVSETKTPKEFRKATIGIFLTAAELLGKTHSELSECLGYNGNPWRKWIADGEMPYVASIACEHLLARKEARPCILMVSAPPDKRTALESVMRAMGIEFTQIVL